MEITAGTIARTAIFALALINQFLSITGHPVIPIQDSDIEALVSYGFTFVSGLIAWWKNNSFTRAARIGDFHMRQIRQVEAENKRLNVKDDDDDAGLPVS